MVSAFQGRRPSAFSSDSEKGSDKENPSDNSDSDLSEAEAALKAAEINKGSTPTRSAAVLKRQPLQKRGRTMVRAAWSNSVCYRPIS